jgi:hypothetical protein
MKKKQRHEQGKKEKEEKAKKRRADYKRRYKAEKRKPEDERIKVLSAGDGVLPVSRKNRMSKAQKEEQGKAIINTLADIKATARS